MSDTLETLLAQQAGGGAPSMGGDSLENLLAAQAQATPSTSTGETRPPLPGLFSRAGMSQLGQNVENLVGGGLHRAASFGSTIIDALNPVTQAVPDKYKLAGTGDAPLTHDARMNAVDSTLTSLGVDPKSLQYKTGDIATSIAGTAGMGGAVSAPFKAAASAFPKLAPFLGPLASSVETGGFKLGGDLPALVSVPTRAAGGAINGAATAAYNDPKDAATGAKIGAALPLVAQAGGQGAQLLRRSLGGTVSPEVGALADRAQQLGIEIPADRLVGSKPLNALASSLNYVPFSGRAATEERMSSQLNQALSKTFGQNDSNVTLALRKADGSLGGQFDTFLKSNSVSMTPNFNTALEGAAKQASDELGPDQAAIILKQIQTIRDKAAADGTIDGQAAYNIKKTLDRIGNRNSSEAWYALDLKGKLMDALNESVGADKAQAFKSLRQQYGNMLTLQKLAKNGAEGEVSAARLANLQNIHNPDVQELADIAAQFIKPREGAHGAAQRVYGAGGLGTIGAAGAYLGGPLGAAIGAGGTIAAGRAANGLLNSGMLRNYVMSKPSPGLLNFDPAPLGMLTRGAYPALSSQ